MPHLEWRSGSAWASQSRQASGWALGSGSALDSPSRWAWGSVSGCASALQSGAESASARATQPLAPGHPRRPRRRARRWRLRRRHPPRMRSFGASSAATASSEDRLHRPYRTSDHPTDSCESSSWARSLKGVSRKTPQEAMAQRTRREREAQSVRRAGTRQRRTGTRGSSVAGRKTRPHSGAWL